jgi:hypothetical protein
VATVEEMVVVVVAQGDYEMEQYLLVLEVVM